jgi:hypothetical protein
VLNYELTAEEIAATWDRISVLQPRGYRAIRDLLPPGAPISDDPSSRVQKLTADRRSCARLRERAGRERARNLLPDRAYGRRSSSGRASCKRGARARSTRSTQRRARIVGAHAAHRRRVDPRA